MYRKIIQELNSYLNFIKIPGNPIKADAFQAVLIKKLSNQNIIKEKRKINAGNAASTVNQTHIDITGRPAILFFFKEIKNATTAAQNIDIDIFYNNLAYLDQIDHSIRYIDKKKNTFFIRRTTEQPPHLTPWDNILHSYAYKKYGHTGEQVQINMPPSKEAFTKLHSHAFQNDALVMLKYDYLHYLSILIPFELCTSLYYITNTHANQHINFVIPNPSYNPQLAHRLQQESVFKDVTYDDIDAITLQNTLINSPCAGTDIEKILKTRISQGSFRRLLLLEHHQCMLCNISTTSVLRASHIKEWSESSKEERIDANNGLILCANHDALFDNHQISFEPETGKLCISPLIGPEQQASLNLPDSFYLSMSKNMKKYMKIHYKKFIEKGNK